MDDASRRCTPRCMAGSRHPLASGAPGRDALARHRADRPAGGEPLPVRGDGRCGKPWDDCIENIDIGGPAMIRAAAKNHNDVAVVVDPADYSAILGDMEAHKGAVTLTLRRRLAQKAYARTAAYDAAISNWMAGELKQEAPPFPRAGRPARREPALWREPAPMGGVLSHAGTAPRCGDRPPASGQAALLQQHQ